MSQQVLIDAAKAPIIAYNQKDWDAFKACVTPGFICDEIGTQRVIRGVEEVIGALKGWATAIPDSKADFHGAWVSGNTVVLEVTWRGTHSGPLSGPKGTIPASGKRVEVRACQVMEVVDGKASVMRHYFDMATILQQVGAV